ncbi:hypothetical protein ACFCYX_19310 [Streptomyces populi]|uniref:hypothetical protein n=1 Tax=Streptomyces populi TaxID=2058924 RepID=UPI0035D5DDF2
MTTNPQTETELLRRAESYLSALHGSVARHDNLAANYGCAGCELRDQIGVALRAAVSVPAPAPTDQTALRDRIAEALDNANRTHPCPVTGDEYWTGCYHPDGTSSSCHTNRRTDAVLAVLPANQTTDRATALSDAANRLERGNPDRDLDFSEGVDWAVDELRRLAAEAQAAAEYSRALATPPSAEALAYLRERLAGRVAGETQQPATSPAETAARIAGDLHNGGQHERALGAEDVTAVLRAGERLAQQDRELPTAFAPGMPCEHGCRAAADELTRETQRPETETEQPLVVHAIPEPGSNGISACCNRPPCEFIGERVTRDPALVTCQGAAVDSQPDGEA